MEHCKKCGRPTDSDAVDSAAEWCGGESDSECPVIAAAFRRGLARGVEIAKEHAEIERHTFRIVPTIIWTDVDRAVREEIEQ